MANDTPRRCIERFLAVGSFCGVFGNWEFLVGLGVFGDWEFLGVFGVFGPKYGKNASKSVVFGNSFN